MRPTDHATAPHKALPAGASTNRERTASTTTVNGLTSAKASSAAGIDSTGTNADEANVRGKIALKPTACADSGELTTRPMNANSHENA